jgi:hypothetical protein
MLGHRSENVAFDAFSCATVPVLSEGGPAKWLKNKNLQNRLCDYEPGGREFESLRAHQLINGQSIIVSRRGPLNEANSNSRQTEKASSTTSRRR